MDGGVDIVKFELLVSVEDLINVDDTLTLTLVAGVLGTVQL